MTTSPKSAWNQGLTLSEALEMYSSDELWGEFEPLHEKFFQVIPADFPYEPIKRERQPQLIVSPIEDFPKYLGLHEKLKTEIITFLGIGKLLAVGFLKPKYRGAEPEWITSNNWNNGGHISWDNSELWINNKTFTEIRVVQPRDPIKINDGSGAITIVLAPAPGRTRSGRPTRAMEIKAAYEELKLEGKIDFISLRTNLLVIQSRVHRRAGSDSTSTKDLEYEAVRRSIGAEFQKDKAERISSKSPS